MRFLMLVCTDSEPDDDRTDDIAGWTAAADGSGRRVLGSPIAAPEDAVTVRVRNGSTDVRPGPFSDTKESIVGFDILECTDLNDAIDVVRTHPMARLGRIEIRAFTEFDDD